MRTGTDYRRIAVFIVSYVLMAMLTVAESKENDLDLLCKGQKIRLDSVWDLLILKTSLEEHGKNCKPHVKNAIQTLVQTVSISKVCSQEATEKIINFVDVYLKNQDGTKEPLPEQLAKFAIAYGLRLSKTCKRDMAFGLSNHIRLQTLPPPDSLYDKMKRFFAKQKAISMMIESIAEPGEVILPSDLIQAVPNLSEVLASYVDDFLPPEKAYEYCKRLKPFYSPVLNPLALLIRNGFNYEGGVISSMEFGVKKFIFNSHSWATIFFICELIKDKKLSSPYHSVKQLAEYCPQSTVQDRLMFDFSGIMKEKIKKFNPDLDPIKRLQVRIQQRRYKIARMLRGKVKIDPTWDAFQALIELVKVGIIKMEKKEEENSEFVSDSDSESD